MYCGTDGVLRGEPRTRVGWQASAGQELFTNVPVPAGTDVPVLSRTLTVNNPDPCREAHLLVIQYADVDFTLPGGGSAASWGFGTDDMVKVDNHGSTAAGAQHVQCTKNFGGLFIPAGGTLDWTLDVTMGFGEGGAVYTRIQWAITALVIST